MVFSSAYKYHKHIKMLNILFKMTLSKIFEVPLLEHGKKKKKKSASYIIHKYSKNQIIS